MKLPLRPLLVCLLLLAVAGTASAGIPWLKLPTTQRFELVFDGEAVLDNETGLIWVRSPNSGTSSHYSGAVLGCGSHQSGGRMGWRLPTLAELTSLIEPCTGICLAGVPALPAGHPFSGIDVSDLDGKYWTSTLTSGGRFLVSFRRGREHVTHHFNNDATHAHVWCVRGDTGR